MSTTKFRTHTKQQAKLYFNFFLTEFPFYLVGVQLFIYTGV